MLKHDLTRQLESADRDCQRQLALAFLLRALKYAPLVLVGLFILDLTVQLPASWRAGFLAAYVVSGGASIVWAVCLTRLRRPSLERTARLLESRDVSLGSKLINYLQLRRNLDAQPPLTRQLSELALEDYSARLAPVDFKPLTKLPEMPRYRRHAAVALGIVFVALACAYPISKLELLRFADPFGDHPPYSMTSIEISEPAADGAQVVYNGGIVIKAKTGGRQPDELFLSFYDPMKPGDVHTAPMFSKGGLGFLQEVEGVKTNLLVYAHTKRGDSVSKKRRVNVALTPQLDHAFVTITPPAYTGLKPAEAPFQFKDLRALAGSEVKFRVRSNRPLAAGSIEVQAADAPPAPVAMTPSGENEVSGAFAASDSGRLKFSLVDVAHNVSQQNLSANLTVTHDLPPEVHLENPSGDSFVCEDFKIEARIVATDDYGLKTIRLHRALNDRFSAPKLISYEPGMTAATERADFNIKDLGVRPGDVISYFAEAVDTCPDPHLARSETVHVMVISVEEYNNSLRERSDISDIQGKYSQLLNEFQDLVDEQKAIDEKLKAKDAPENLEKLLARQAELNKKLADMAAQMEKFVRDKPLYDIEKELQQTLTEKAAEIRSSLAQSEEALKQAAEKAAAPAGGPQQEKRLQALASLQGQSKQQLAKLDQTRKDTEDRIIPPLEDAEKMNLILNDLNIFKALYEAQSAAVEQTKPMMNVASLSDTDKLALKQLAGTEKQMEGALQKVAADLREHGIAARVQFPKASRSAQDFADKMEQSGLSGLAGRAATTMLAASGADSYQSAEKLRQEMKSFFDDSEGQQGAACTEMDKYLKLRRNLTAGQTGKQMAQGRKPGQGSPGSTGQGQGGLDGYATSAGQSLGMLGGETSAGQSPRPGSGNHGQAMAAGPGQVAKLDGTDLVKGVNNASRATGSVQTENTVEGYRDAIDAYFNTITK